ncbi:MAG TPA: cytochrome P450 [Gammaproteobacteria bacterium]|nr:cytochrome P450 [Gammaproteobacteria bacterium]
MFIRNIIDYGYYLLFGEATSESLADEVRTKPHGVLKKNYGWLGGDVYFVNPAPKPAADGHLVDPPFKTAEIFNTMDQKPHGRLAESGLRYLLGGDFIIAKTEQRENQHFALNHHQLFTRSLTRPSDYIHSTLNALQKFIELQNGECSMRSLSTVPLRNSIAKGLFDLEEITPEFNRALESFTGLTEERVEKLDTTVWTKLRLAYYGWLLNYMPKIIAARDQFVISVDQVIGAQEDKVLSDLHNYDSQIPTNIISLSIIQLIREKIQTEHQDYSTDETAQALKEYLPKMTLADLKPYLSDPYIRTLPAVISPADMIMIPTICALTQLASNQELQQQLREEIAERRFFEDDDSSRMQRNIEDDKRNGGLLHRIFLESLRREYPQKNIHDLERSTILWRYCEDGMTLGEENIPPGSLIAVLNALQRFDINIWHNPEVFNPDRFRMADGTLNKELENVVMTIFTESRRKCPANRVTEYIFQTFIAHIVSHHKLELATDINETNVDNIRLRISPVNSGMELRVSK